MDDEDAFLAALTANPTDDVCRLVFADWLEEREQFDKATYLRLACRAAEALGTPDEAAVTDQVLAASERLPWQWRDAAAGRFRLVLVEYPPDQKIGMIKLLRDLWGRGLAETKAEAERLPNRLISGATLEDAVGVRVLLQYRESVVLNVEAGRGAAAKKPVPPFTNHRYDLVGRFTVPTYQGDQFSHLSDELQAVMTQYVQTYADSGVTTTITCPESDCVFVLCENVSLTHVARRLPAARAEGNRLATAHRLRFHLYPRRLPPAAP